MIKEIQEKYDMWADDFNLDPQDVEWMIIQSKRIQELNDEIDRLNGALHYQLRQENLRNEENRKLRHKNKRYRKALEEIMKIQENHEWNLYGIAYGIAEITLFEVEGEE